MTTSATRFLSIYRLSQFCRPVSQFNRRFLSLHEGQAMELMRSHGVLTPRFVTANSPQEAMAAVSKLSSPNFAGEVDCVVKAQVLAGGRGLGYFKETNFQGGVHVCSSAAEVRDIASQMIGKTLITKQTGEIGKPCNSVVVAERFYIRKEKYFAIVVDRGAGGILMIGSAVGGTSIEDIAHHHPDAIVKMKVDISLGLAESQATEFAKKLGFDTPKKISDAVQCISGLYKMFVSQDCTLLEINPFAETSDGRVVACDAKVNFDDFALFKHPDLSKMQDLSQEDPREIQAAKFDLNYVGLDGNIGCVVNGAGLAMATMDLIKLHGGVPSNFLDVGGGASAEQVTEALRILQNDEKVKSIFVNIFGGIMKCDVIALGLVNATKKLGLSKPMVIRLEGTNREKAKTLLEDNGMKIIFCSDFDEGAKKAVKMAEIAELANLASLKVQFSM